MEILDYYDENNEIKLGEEEREYIHNNNLWHREVEIWVMNMNNEILLQKRSPYKRFAPNMYAVCAGHIDAGEDIKVAAIRELKEETSLSITPDELIFIGEFRRDRVNNKHVTYSYLVKTTAKVSDMVMQEEEVSELRYISIKDLKKKIEENDKDLTISNAKEILKIISDYKN